MAQDFKHAFYPGRDDKGISTLEFDGVELRRALSEFRQRERRFGGLPAPPEPCRPCRH